MGGTGINCYGMGMGQINMSHGQPRQLCCIDCDSWCMDLEVPLLYFRTPICNRWQESTIYS